MKPFVVVIAALAFVGLFIKLNVDGAVERARELDKTPSKHGPGPAHPAYDNASSTSSSHSFDIAPAHCLNWVEVSAASEHYVSQKLKAPATASFPTNEADWIIAKEGRVVTCRSYVDAQNSFGAMIRQRFSIQLQCTDNGFKLLALDLY